ncbi:PVC-type heme-binding CxxCH protein [Parapedobacter tibetensis]|uniref:PVC-type heme-binding CxxCH protein n=1 Tax=Parapedobacter tibetensis TaxID=2972951 RepID=UPI00214DBEFD|nr:PVC-type heme-binding CxxCH protein [Parapedobacter tibetensis]
MMNIKATIYFFAVPLFFCILLLSCESARYDDALSPEKALESFTIAAGFTIETFASEPYIIDPVDMVFDESGNIYLIEMGDYPYKPELGEGKGKIKLLKDVDGDGKIDSVVVFAEGIQDATSLLPWDGGVIVTSAPDILYLKDTDGDGIADEREVLFTGFFENNSEAQITSLRYGVDNWIYANNNGQIGAVKFNRLQDAPAVSVGGGDFRFRLDKNLFEAESGAGQFGLAVDDWGNRFFTQNTLHIQTAPIPRRYLHRHGYLPSYSSVSNIYAHDLRVYQISEPPYWRVARSTRRQQQYDEAGLDRTEHIEGHFTGASGGTLYAADLFPESFYGNVFTAEVACNLIHRDVIVPIDEGPFFSARRDSSELEREFLASKDTWFRPVNFSVGPDGALYIIDMYRQHIETPVSIPDDLKTEMDFLYGNQYGRVYKVYPEDKTPPALASPNLRDVPTAELVDLLTRNDQWWRIQAQRLIVERQDKSIIPALEEMVHQHSDPRTRLHALYSLEGLDALTGSIVEKALDDQDAQVRRHAIVLSERYPENVRLLATKVDDPASQTAFQATLSIGQFSDEVAVAVLAKVVQQHGGDDWFRKAVLSSEAGSSVALLEMLSKARFFDQSGNDKISFLTDFAYVIGARGKLNEIQSLVRVLTKANNEDSEKLQLAYLAGLAKGVGKATFSGDQKQQMITLLEAQKKTSADVEKAVDGVVSALSQDNG